MKVIIQRTRRKKTESGFYFNENPQIINVCHEFPCRTKKENGLQKIHIGTVPFGKHYSECDKKINPCIPTTALTYTEGTYNEIPSRCEECK